MCDGKGYHKRLKSLWDTRNPSKTSISINILACHVRNVLTAGILTDVDIKMIEDSILKLGRSVSNDQFLSDSQARKALLHLCLSLRLLLCHPMLAHLLHLLLTCLIMIVMISLNGWQQHLKRCLKLMYIPENIYLELHLIIILKTSVLRLISVSTCFFPPNHRFLCSNVKIYCMLLLQQCVV